MPLNYSKWDALEVSDDSDIEGHPNVDHKSLVRWKQRQIHEERETRKLKIDNLKADIESNFVLERRMRQVRDGVKEKGPSFFSSTVERLEKNPSPEKPPEPLQGTYDGLLLVLLRRVADDVKNEGVNNSDPKLEETIIKALQTHIDRMPEFRKKAEADLANEEKDRQKKITSEDIHDGFDSTYVPARPEPPPVPGGAASKDKKTKTSATKTEFEVLNPKGVATSQPEEEQEADESDGEVPEMTPTLEAFSRLPYGDFEKSWEFIKEHRDVVVPGASDALLVAAFRAERDGKPKYAKQCTHQSLLLQYGEKLGRDGVSIFFRKMTNADPKATAVFLKDVEDTYKHIIGRVKASKEEEAAARAAAEQIQLVPENPDAEVSFNVPDGPPPEDIKLEGPNIADLDIEEVRQALQMQWEVYSAFDPKLQEALKTQELDEVNKVLGAMKVEDAEGVVQLLEVSGILNFAEGGVRDQTGDASEDV